MSILPVMILVSMLVVVGAGIAFFWAVDHDQFEDLQSPAFLPLMDDAAPPAPQASRPTAGEPEEDAPATAARTTASDTSARRQPGRA